MRCSSPASATPARKSRSSWCVTATQTSLAGRDTGHIPFRIEGLASRLVLARLVLRVVFHRVLTIATPIGRKVRPKILHGGGPLIRLKPKELAAAGIERVRE